MEKFKSIIAKNPKKIKRIVFFGLIIFGLVLLFLPNATYADMVGSLLGEQAYTKNVSDLIKMVSHIVYVFIWPCLVIAGTALDNSLIYGSFLHLDAALWNIWNIMKNFANFALGFLFVFTIVVNLFKGADGKSDPMKNAVGTIKSTLLAGVLVQMSWFIIAVLIDISTILIYAVGGLPLSMLGTYNKDVANIPIMKMNTEISNDDFYYYYSYGGHNYSPCLLVNKEGDVSDNIPMPSLTGEYIAGRQRLFLSDGVTFETGYCTLNGFLYKYKESNGFFCDLEGGTPGGTGCYQQVGSTVAEINSGYYSQLVERYLKPLTTGNVEQAKNSCFLINAYGMDYKDTTSCEPLCSGYGAVPYTGDVFATTTGGFSLKELLNKSKGWVGPFVTMYSSVLNYQELVMNPESGSLIGTLFGFIINTFFALILFLPMAILAILLVVRVGYLWIVVAISPILMLGYAFEKTEGDSPLKKLSGIFGKRFNIKNVLMQIFSPVIVVFAISLCLIFLSTIYKSKPTLEGASDELSAFGIQCVEEELDEGNACVSQNRKCSYSILGLVTIKINAQNYNHGKDMFVWILMELLATGIVRFFMKFAIELTGNFSEKNLGKELMSTAEKYVTTMPILKLPGVDGRVGLQALGIGEGNENEFISNFKSKISDLERKQDASIRNKFGNDNTDSSGNESSGSATISEAINFIKDNKNVKFNELKPEYTAALATVGYNDQNFDSLAATIRDDGYKNVITAGSTVSKTTSDGKTNAEAVRYTSSQMDIAVKSIDGWKAWAASIVGGSIELLDGVFMVDYVAGTQRSANPQYRIVTRDVYERDHFGKPVENLAVDDYNKMQDEDKKALRKHFDELQEEIKQLNDIKKRLDNKETLSDVEQKQSASLQHQTNGIASLTQDIIDKKLKDLGIK